MLEKIDFDPGVVASWQTVDSAWLRSPSGREVELPLPAGRGQYAAVAARLQATPMREADARLIVERNLQTVPGGWSWRSDPRLRLPSSTRLPEAAIRAILQAIEAPTLLVAAEPSPPYFPPALRAERVACLRDATLHVLEGGHHVHMERAPEVGALLRDFLAD